MILYLFLYICVHLLPPYMCVSYPRCVSICSLAFSMEGLYLSASSNTETVHIFKLETQKEKYVYVPFCFLPITSDSEGWDFLPVYFCFMFLREMFSFRVCVCVGQRRSPPHGEGTWERS